MEEFADDLSEEEIEEVKTLEAELHFKREFSRERREELAKQGHALPDGSFPISTVEDLKNAIQAYGRAGNKKLAKEHIIKRATQMGKESLLPDDWKGEKAADEENFYKSLAEFEEIQLELDELGDS
jgi:hypothetical protein